MEYAKYFKSALLGSFVATGAYLGGFALSAMLGYLSIGNLMAGGAVWLFTALGFGVGALSGFEKK